MKDIEFAWKVAEDSHEGQLYNGKNYIINHIHPVQLAVLNLPGVPKKLLKKCRVVAIMHDSLEDSNIWTLSHLRSCYDEDITDALDAITRRENEKYLEEYIPRLSQNDIACIVKKVDLEKNLEQSIIEDNQSLIIRYTKALNILTGVKENGSL